MSSKITFELEWEQVDSIVVKQLKEAYAGFDDTHKPPTFSMDPKENAKQCKKHKKAIELILDWYGVKVV